MIEVAGTFLFPFFPFCKKNEWSRRQFKFYCCWPLNRMSNSRLKFLLGTRNLTLEGTSMMFPPSLDLCKSVRTAEAGFLFLFL
jgi:hypothetical protein